MSDLFLRLSLVKEIPVLNANSADPDQMPNSVASDLGLHCLQWSHLWDARLKWVNKSAMIHTINEIENNISIRSIFILYGSLCLLQQPADQFNLVAWLVWSLTA